MKFDLNLESINYIKIIYNDKNDIGHCTKAAIKQLNAREIFACIKSEKFLAIPAPQEVSVSFACNNGIYTTITTLKSVENREPFIYFTLKTPQEIQYSQNREYFRVKMSEDAILSFSGTVLACKVYDISANGIRLCLDKEIEIPENVMINILFPQRNVKTKAKYVRIDKEDDILKASFYYINLSEHDRDIISQRCIQKQLSDKRRSIL